jgi:NAD(P)-dependent dehydrogenase (short-subunit alcohol dehydrogenase family)
MRNVKPNGKVAFITGANRGLGLETARELGKLGIVVVLGSRDSKKGEAAAAKIRDEGITAESLGFDVTKSQDHQKAYDYFAKKYGRLDILVNNAGVLKESQLSTTDSAPNPTSAVSPEVLRETFETNFFAPVALTQKLLPLIRKAPAGRIVNVSSILSSLTLRLRLLESCAQCLHRASRSRAARHQNQSELRASRLGEDRDGRPKRANGS